MMKLERKILSIAAAVLLAGVAGSVHGQEQKPMAQQETPAPAQQETPSQVPSEAVKPPAAPARLLGPHVTGTIVRSTLSRIDLKLANGKTQKVAVNKETERQVDLKEGVKVTVEYRRKISGFVIAMRIVPAEAGADGGKDQQVASLTGTVVSWNKAALLLRTADGEVTLYLAPTTKYLVPSLDPGLRVTVEYSRTSNGDKLAERVLAAATEKKTGAG
jgi:hypothetical protein